MASAVPPTIDSPYLAIKPDDIEQLLRSAQRPLDMVCGLLATDPGLLLHLLRHFSRDCALSETDFGLRFLAGVWLQSEDHSWHRSILPVRFSALSQAQRAEHRLLCARASIAAGLIGEWLEVERPSVQQAPELLEAKAVMAVWPSLLQLCRIEDGVCYASVAEERSAWLQELAPYLGRARAKVLQPSEELNDPANVAVEIAAAAVTASAQAIIQRKLPEWSRRLDRDPSLLQQDLARVTQALQLMAESHSHLEPQQIRSFVQGSKDTAEGEDCAGCRQRAFDNALSTIRNRLVDSDIPLVEAIDHLMYALCHCGSLRRVQWYVLDERRQLLQSKRRKSVRTARPLDARDLPVSAIPVLQVLLERPRSIQVSPVIREQLSDLLPSDVDDSFEPHHLSASVFCGSEPLGVIYADADGASIGAAEAAKFKALAQLATKVATLLALRHQKSADLPDTSQLAYPDYASFDGSVAANELEDESQSVIVKRDVGSR